MHMIFRTICYVCRGGWEAAASAREQVPMHSYMQTHNVLIRLPTPNVIEFI